MAEEKSKSPQICPFYKIGKCRFGADCFKQHSGPVTVESSKNPTQKKKSLSFFSESKNIHQQSKSSMKTALDVIKRIQWDENLPPEYFTIGYVDRFEGIIEDQFTKFSNWGHLDEAEYEALAIPQHRIEYFKYKGTKVWDKKSRIDLVFGSSGDNGGKTIEDIMNEIDDDAKLKSDANFESDSDSDDDDINIHIDSNIQVNLIPEEERSTHFLAIRITNPQVVQAAQVVQKDAVKQEEILSDCCMGSGLFHVTLGMLRLDGDEGEWELVKALHDIQLELQEFTKDLSLNISGLNTFGQRVLYAQVLPQPEELFWQFVSLVRSCVSQTSDKVNVTNKFELTPHMTLIKVNRPIARLRKSKYLPSALYEKHQDLEFGVQKVDNLQLCVIEDTTRADGFYRTLTELKF